MEVGAMHIQTLWSSEIDGSNHVRQLTCQMNFTCLMELCGAKPLLKNRGFFCAFNKCFIIIEKILLNTKKYEKIKQILFL